MPMMPGPLPLASPDAPRCAATPEAARSPRGLRRPLPCCGGSALLGLPEDLADLLDLRKKLVGHGHVDAALRAGRAGELDVLVEQCVELRLLLEVCALEGGGLEHSHVVLDQRGSLWRED